MRLLLDTHILLWALASPERLPEEVRCLLKDLELEETRPLWCLDVSLQGPLET